MHGASLRQQQRQQRHQQLSRMGQLVPGAGAPQRHQRQLVGGVQDHHSGQPHSSSSSGSRARRAATRTSTQLVTTIMSLTQMAGDQRAGYKC